MHMLNVGFVVVLLLGVFAIFAWAYVRLKQNEVKMAKVGFAQEQLQFAQEQFRAGQAFRTAQLHRLANAPAASRFGKRDDLQ